MAIPIEVGSIDNHLGSFFFALLVVTVLNELLAVLVVMVLTALVLLIAMVNLVLTIVLPADQRTGMWSKHFVDGRDEFFGDGSGGTYKTRIA